MADLDTSGLVELDTTGLVPVDDGEEDFSYLDTKLAPDQERLFQEWKKRNAPSDSGFDYDLRGAFVEGFKPAANGHWPDKYKKPNHPTFSDESKFAKDFPDRAGHWNGDTYVAPGAKSLDTSGLVELDTSGLVERPQTPLAERVAEYEEQNPFFTRMGQRLKAGALNFQASRAAGSALSNIEFANRQTEAMDAIDRGELQPPEGNQFYYFNLPGLRQIDVEQVNRYYRMDPEQRQAFRAKREQETAQDLHTAASKSAESAAIPRNPAVADFAQAMGAGDYGAATKILLTNPVGIVGQVSTESFPTMLPGLAAGLINPALGAAVMGGMSGAQEYGSSVLDYLQQQGVNTSDPAAIQAALANADLRKAAADYASTRSLVVGSVDTASGGLAGKMLVPGKLVSGVIKREAANELIAQPIAQAAAGAAGEAAAQKLSTGEVSSPADVALEAIGEFGTAPAEAASFGIRQRLNQKQPGVVPSTSDAGPAAGPTPPPTGAAPETPSQGSGAPAAPASGLPSEGERVGLRRKGGAPQAVVVESVQDGYVFFRHADGTQDVASEGEFRRDLTKAPPPPTNQPDATTVPPPDARATEVTPIFDQDPYGIQENERQQAAAAKAAARPEPPQQRAPLPDTAEIQRLQNVASEWIKTANEAQKLLESGAPNARTPQEIAEMRVTAARIMENAAELSRNLTPPRVSANDPTAATAEQIATAKLGALGRNAPATSEAVTGPQEFPVTPKPATVTPQPELQPVSQSEATTGPQRFQVTPPKPATAPAQGELRPVTGSEAERPQPTREQPARPAVPWQQVLYQKIKGREIKSLNNAARIAADLGVTPAEVTAELGRIAGGQNAPIQQMKGKVRIDKKTKQPVQSAGAGKFRYTPKPGENAVEDLYDFVLSMGGIKPSGSFAGELASRDLGKYRKAFKGTLVRADARLNAEQMANAAMEEGFLVPTESGEIYAASGDRVGSTSANVGRFLDMLEGNASGSRRHYRMGEEPIAAPPPEETLAPLKERGFELQAETAEDLGKQVPAFEAATDELSADEFFAMQDAMERALVDRLDPEAQDALRQEAQDDYPDEWYEQEIAEGPAPAQPEAAAGVPEGGEPAGAQPESESGPAGGSERAAEAAPSPGAQGESREVAASPADADYITKALQQRLFSVGPQLIGKFVYYSRLRPLGFGFPIKGEAFDPAHVGAGAEKDRVLVTNEPIPIEQLNRLELTPVTPMARVAAFKDAYAATPGAQPGRYEMVNPSRRDIGAGASITKSAKEDGFYQVTMFDERGFSGDMQDRSLDNAIKTAVSMGYVEPSPGIVSDMMQLDTFKIEPDQATSPAETPPAATQPVKTELTPEQKQAEYQERFGEFKRQQAADRENKFPPAGLWKQFQDRGLIEQVDGQWRLTDFGRAYYESIQDGIDAAGKRAQDAAAGKTEMTSEGEQPVLIDVPKSAVQAQKAREAKRGRGSGSMQAEPGGMFAPPEEPDTQTDLEDATKAKTPEELLERISPTRPKKNPSFIDRLANYFRPGRVVPSYGGFDRVISFNRVTAKDGSPGWVVRVREVDAKNNPTGPIRSHTTAPSKQALDIWERDNPVMEDRPGLSQPVSDGKRVGEYQDLTPDLNDRMLGQSKAERIETGRDWVLENGRRTNHEYLVATTRSGALLSAGTANLENGVSFGQGLINAMMVPGANIDIQHNHPNGGPLSDKDVGILACPGAGWMIAWGNNGKFYAARLSSRFVDAIKHLSENDRQQLILWAKSNAFAASLVKHRPFYGTTLSEEQFEVPDAAWRALHEAGIIDYLSGYELPDHSYPVVDLIRDQITERLLQHGIDTRIADRSNRPAVTTGPVEGLAAVSGRPGKAAAADAVRKPADSGSAQGSLFEEKGPGLRAPDSPISESETGSVLQRLIDDESGALTAPDWKRIKDTFNRLRGTRSATQVAREGAAKLKIAIGSKSMLRRLSNIGQIAQNAAWLAGQDAASAAHYNAVLKRERTKNQLQAEAFAKYTPYAKLNEKDRRTVDAMLEYYRLYGVKPADNGRNLAVRIPDRKPPFGDARPVLSKPGQVLAADAKMTEAILSLTEMFSDTWNKLHEAMAREAGYQGAWNEEAIKRTAETANDQRTRRAANLALRIWQNQQESEREGYSVPLQRYGDTFIAVHRKVPEETEGGKPESTHVEFIDTRSIFRDVYASTRGGDHNQSVADRIEALKKQFPEKDYTITHGPVTPQALSTINLPDIERAMMEMNIASEGKYDDAIQKLLNKLYEERKAGPRRRARNVGGYSLDFERAIQDYVMQMSSVIANISRRDEMNSTYDATQLHPDGAIRDYWKSYRNYQEKTGGDFARTRKLGFYLTMWGNPSSAALDLAQTPLVTQFQLAGWAGARAPGLAHGAMMEAMAATTTNADHGIDMAWNKLGKNAFEKAALKEAVDEGRMGPQISHEFQGGTMFKRMPRHRPLLKGIGRLWNYGASMKNWAEQVNRGAAFLAALRAAQNPQVRDKALKFYGEDELFKEQVGNSARQVAYRREALRRTTELVADKKMEEADRVRAAEQLAAAERRLSIDIAKFFVDDTQFVAGKVNRAPMMRGIGGVAFQFKNYVLNYLRLAHRNWTRQGMEGKIVAGMMLGSLLLASGLLGLPGAEDLLKLAENFVEHRTGVDPNWEYRFRSSFGDSAWGQLAAEIITRGLARGGATQDTLGIGVDMSGRIGMGQLAPDDSIMSLAPVVSTIYNRYNEYVERSERGQPLGAMAAVNGLLGGKAGYDWSRAFARYYEGVKTQYGNTVKGPDEVGIGELGLTALGMQPTSVARAQEKAYANQRLATATQQKKSRATTRLATIAAEAEAAFEAGDEAKAEKLYQKLDAELDAQAEAFMDPDTPDWRKMTPVQREALKRRVLSIIEPEVARLRSAPKNTREEIEANPYPE